MSTTPSNNGTWFAVSIGLIGVIIGYAIGSASPDAAPQAAPQAAQQPTVAAAPAPTPSGDVKAVDPEVDNVRGDPDAVISVIEYSDFECPFCQRHHPTMAQLLEDYDGKINWVFRHFPLSFHPNAQKAAEASQCARELGGNDAFWEFSDIVFEKGPDNAQLGTYAEEIGLDAQAFKDCVDSGKYTKYVQDQIAEGQAAGVRGTPGNIVYNNETKESRIISGAQPLANFKVVIDEML